MSKVVVYQKVELAIDSIPLGLYEVEWAGNGGRSLVAIGQLYDGRRWMAPVNWTAKETTVLPTTCFSDVASLTPIKLLRDLDRGN